LDGSVGKSTVQGNLRQFFNGGLGLEIAIRSDKGFGNMSPQTVLPGIPSVIASHFAGLFRLEVSAIPAEIR
jgi:hypothetical protein